MGRSHEVSAFRQPYNTVYVGEPEEEQGTANSPAWVPKEPDATPQATGPAGEETGTDLDPNSVIQW